jgi:hypothetical protein
MTGFSFASRSNPFSGFSWMTIGTEHKRGTRKRDKKETKEEVGFVEPGKNQ